MKRRTDDGFLRSAQKDWASWKEMLDKKADLSRSQDRIHPQALARIVSDLAAEDAVFCVDTGEVTPWSGNRLRPRAHQRITGSYNNAAAGVALGMASGVHALDRNRQVIALCGDGGFAMLMQEFATSAQRGTQGPVIVDGGSWRRPVRSDTRRAGAISAILRRMTQRKPVRPSEGLANVRYEIRGKLARRALALERLGYDIVSLNIGNPYAFGFRTPETMRLAMIENLRNSEGYVHQKGIFPAREAVVMQQQERGVRGVTAEEVYIGNGVSELIDLSLRALLNPGDEVLVPSPDYPLWTAAVNLNTGRAVHYPCLATRSFIPDPQDIEALVTKRTRAIVIVNPNNPTGAVYPRETLAEIARMAEKHRLVVLSDEIYDQILYDDAEFVPMATLVHNTLCCTMSGLSKVYRACGYRVGWAAFSGDVESASEYLNGLELLSSLRLCSNVPGQWAVQTALGGYQSIRELTRPGGRLYESRRAILDGVGRSSYLRLSRPMGALYSFVEVRTDVLPDFDDQVFALDLLENKHVLVAPGVSFNVPYRNCFRITNLPEPQLLATVFERIEEVLEAQAAARPELQLVGSVAKVQH